MCDDAPRIHRVTTSDDAPRAAGAAGPRARGTRTGAAAVANATLGYGRV